jgi:hypothetical protein
MLKDGGAEAAIMTYRVASFLFAPRIPTENQKLSLGQLETIWMRFSPAAIALAYLQIGNSIEQLKFGSNAVSHRGRRANGKKSFSARSGPKENSTRLLTTRRKAESCTEQLGIPGPWYKRLPRFRMNFTPSSGSELQTEYFVLRDTGYEAILVVETHKDQISPHLFISELRTIAADDLWISPCYQRPSLAIHFTWKPEWPHFKQLLAVIQNSYAPFNARPHWASYSRFHRHG